MYDPSIDAVLLTVVEPPEPAKPKKKRKRRTSLEERKARYTRTLEAIERYVMRVIRNLYEPDARGRYPKLEGNTSSMSLRALPAKVEYLPDGESQVTAKYKTLTIKLPAERWEQLLDSLDMETAGDLIDAVKKA